ncbi:MAG: NmrA family NAD(P)-binding protein [Myxococcales bacterium]
MYVISGATGNTGKVAAQQLLRAGKKVRALVRNADKAADLAALGAELWPVDLSDGPGLERALDGAQGLYLLSPPDMGSQSFLAERSQLLGRVAQVLKKAAVPHVVFLSSIGAQHESGTGIIQSVHAGEVALRAAGVTSTFLRAAYFVENWAPVLPVAKQDGVLPSFIPGDLRLPMVCTADIGSLAATALLEGPRGARVLELSGPEDVTPKDVAAVVSKLLGRPIQLVEPPLDAVVPTFTSFGISADVARLFQQMYEGIRNGRVSAEGGQAEARRGTTTLEQTLRALSG